MFNASDRVRRKYFVFILILIFLAATWVSFFPGFMSSDSLVQYEISRSLRFTDWHPPVMSGVWWALNFVFPGPSGMLFLQLSTLWGAIFSIWYAYQEKRFSSLLLLVPFFPWILNFEAVLWKDVGMAFAILLLSSMVLFRPSVIKVIFATIILFYTINLRHNAIPAVLPVVLLLVTCWLPRFSVLKAAVVSLLVVGFAVVLGQYVSYNLLHAERTRPSNYMMVDDLVYISVKNNFSLIPGIELSTLQKCAFTEIGQTNLVGKIFCLSSDANFEKSIVQNDNLKTKWMAAILQHPLDYAQYRFAAFGYLLRAPDLPPYYIWHAGIDENNLGVNFTPNRISVAAGNFVSISADYFPFLFKPYWWLLFSFALLCAHFLFKKSKTVLYSRILLLSSIFYILGYIPLTPMADFRYVYWSVLASSLSFVLLVIDLPGLIRPLSWRRVALVLSPIVLVSALVLNLQRLAPINLNTAMDLSLDKGRLTLDAPSSLADLRKIDGPDYEVIGPDPHMVFDTDQLQVRPRDLDWIRFQFSCLFSKAAPRLQLFWWEEQSQASEAQSLSLNLAEGVNLIPAAKLAAISADGKISRIRFDLEDFKACSAIRLNNVQFIGRQAGTNPITER